METGIERLSRMFGHHFKDVDPDKLRKELYECDMPHCTSNERAFLDEIREKFIFGDYENEKVLCFEGSPIETKYSLIYAKNFTKTNLSELVEGKG